MKYFLTSFFSLCLAVSIFAGTGTIAGKIIDAKTGDVMFGATVLVKGSTLGAVTDFDGNYIIESVPEGNQTLVVNYVGYTTKEVDGVIVKTGEVASVDLSMAEASNMIEAVVIRASRKAEAAATILVLQKNNVTVSDGISGAAIRNSPDKNTSEVIRRVSGVTIQDNKFPVIRGLNDRYNVALVNGTLLPSTEPDKKAFSFDLFPSNLIDNIIVNKAATADLPADFAGGIIQLTTKDIPDENYVSAQLSTGINTQSTGNTFLEPTAKGKTDFLGIDDGTRALPAGLPNTQTFNSANQDDVAKYSQLFSNDWAISQRTATPNIGAQVTAGFSKRNADTKSVFGGVVALTYNRSERITESTRKFYITNREQNFDYTDRRYVQSYLNGALANFSYKINDNNKISLKNTFNINTEQTVVTRTGRDFVNDQLANDNIARYRSNKLFTSQLSGDHVLNTKGVKIKWIGGFSNIDRDIPNQRQMLYRASLSNHLENPDDPINYTAAVPSGSASPFLAGKFFSQLNERLYTFSTEASIPFKIKDKEQTLKVGGSYLQRTRDFAARIMGVVRAGNGANRFLGLPQDKIFDKANFGTNAFAYGDITNSTDKYDANTQTTAAFAMLDSKVTEKFRASFGLRLEAYPIQFNSVQNGKDVKIDTTFRSLMPSLNLTYALTEKSNLRLCGSRTLSRPELRELAPFTFYDLELNANRVGNSNLKVADIYNADLRYEIFPEGGQLFSISAFYKYFINPIEEVIDANNSTLNISYVNAKAATNYGLELEFRKTLNFIGAGFWENMTAFSNLALIQSEVEIGTGVSAEKRALQGQSPYILNAGIQYNNSDNGWSSTVLFNQIGRRISQVGSTDYPTVYENPRPLLDFQLGKKFGKSEFRFNVSDILNRRLVFYQDIEKNGKFTEGKDNDVSIQRFGTNMSLSFNYKF